MFTSVIGTLTSLLPKYFIFGSYVPVLIFSFINLALVYLLSAWSRAQIEFWLAKSTPLAIAVAFVATVVIAYVLSAINDFLREFLEGKHIWPRFLEQALYNEQKARRRRLADRYANARRQRFVLSSVIDRGEQLLRDANAQGRQAPQKITHEAVDRLAELRELVRAGALHDSGHDSLPPEMFAENVAAISRAVGQMTRRIRACGTPITAEVESNRRDLLLLMGAILNSMRDAEYSMGMDLFTRFGNDPVKPTRIGNIAAAIQAYTLGRYKMEMTVFFSRLQTVLVRAQDKGYDLVLDAKTQLDFLIACWWLSALTTALWTMLLVFFGGDGWPYLGVAVFGTAATVAFYFLTGENYLAYGEVVRACIDVNRFALLRELRMRLPDTLRDERALWSTMSHLAFSGGDSIELSYDKEQAKEKTP